MKILVSHPTGNANVKYALQALLKARLLQSFHTSIASFPNNIWGRLSSFEVLSDFKRRQFSTELQAYTQIHPYKEIGRIVSEKLQLHSLIAHETGIFCIDKVYDYLDRCVAGKLKDKNIDAVYAYEDGALASFKAAKINKKYCLYDLPIGYWRAAKVLLQEEIYNRPEWANTFAGFKDSDVKLEKKDAELSLADHIFVASSFTGLTLKDYPGKIAPISVIPYGFPDVITKKDYSDLNNRPLRLLFVGGLSQRKGIANILEAVEGFGNDIALTIIGQKSTPDCKPLNVGLKKHTWIPSLSHAQILNQMRKHDILLFPSLFEGFGLVITEAMSQGTPVITTRRTAGADFIEHEKNGWLIEPGSTSELVKVIENLLNNSELVSQVGQEALTTASKRNWLDYGNDLVADILKITQNS